MQDTVSTIQGAEEAMAQGELIAERYNPRTLIPFPFRDIFEAEDISFSFLPDDRKFDGISGAIYFSGDDVRIFVKEGEKKERQQFTIAHELGHYFLHRDDLKQKGGALDPENVLTMYRSDLGLDSDKEREANYFAGSLIMPKEKVKKAWKKLTDIERCAEVFDVSKSAMAVRLSVLHLID